MDLGVDITAFAAAPRAKSIEGGSACRRLVIISSPAVGLQSLLSQGERFAMATDDIAQCFAQTVQKVPPVGDL